MHGVELDIEEYVSTFIRRMRRHEKIRNLPSIRQGIALIQFLHARYHRNARLSMQDVLEGSIITTYYEDQAVAHEIAHELIMSALHERIVEQKGPRSYGSYEKLWTLSNYAAEYMKDVAIIDRLLSAEKNIFTDPMKMLEEIYAAIKDRLTLADLQFLESRGMLEERLSDITDKKMQIYAHKLVDQPDQWKKHMHEYMHPNSNENSSGEMNERLKENLDKHPQDMAQIFKNMEKLNTSASELQPFIEEYVENLKSWSEYLHLLKETGISQAPPENLVKNLTMQQLNEMESHLNNLKWNQRHDLLKNFMQSETLSSQNHQLQLAQLLDRLSETTHFDENMKNDLKNQMEQLSFEDLHQCLDGMTANDQSQMQTKGHDISRSRDDNSLTRKDNSQNRNDESFNGPKTQHKQHKQHKPQTQEFLRKMAEKLMQKSPTAQQFLDTIHQFVEKQIPFDHDLAQETANLLEVDQAEFDMLLNQPVRHLEDMIQSQLPELSPYLEGLNQLPPNFRRTDELIQNGIQLENSSFLGAMTEFDLQAIAQNINKCQDPRIDALFLQGLQKASGDNLLREWFFSRNSIPPRIRTMLKTYLQQFTLDKAMLLVKSQMGSIKHGLAHPHHDLRFYRPGDAISQVDLEETVTHLLDQGKHLSDLQAQDILCRSEGGSSIKTFLILDKSGSMEGIKMQLATFTASILTYLLPPEDFSVLLFDSDTYLWKKFDQRVDREKIISNFLDLTAGGGTRIARTLDTLLETCGEGLISQKYIAFLFSDLAIYETPLEIRNQLKLLQKYQMEFHIINPETSEIRVLNYFQTFLRVKPHFLCSLDLIPQLITEAFKSAIN
ncbi:MAG: VWA domain-containing protein [Promethearchaeota archaeon]|nr:MAG: VWA domain-containing protein [Candidatus Lokiarchaeota archaeon]